jgi:Polyketide cyclase / dehydrase and lipid transport
MRTVHASVGCRASPHQAQTAWCDTSRWELWVDGLAEVVSVGPGWPNPGSEVSWRSGSAGRGSVAERVLAYTPLEAIDMEVEDDYIRGRQYVAFAPVDTGTEVTLSLSYAIKRRNPFTPVVDLLFVSRAMQSSLATTLARFAAQLRG